MRCAVKDCKNSNKSPATSATSFFTFPLDAYLLKRWTNFCGQKKFNTKSSHICMDHFRPEDIENNLQYEMGFAKRRLLRHGVVPTIKKTSTATKSNERARRIEKREYKKIVELLLKEHDEVVTASKRDKVSEVSAFLKPVEHFAYEADQNSDEDNIEIEFKRISEETLMLRKAQKEQTDEWKALLEKYEKEMETFKETSFAGGKHKLSSLEKLILSFITTGLIARLKASVERTTFAEENFTQSITLLSESSKLYKLLYEKTLPLPAVSKLD